MAIGLTEGETLRAVNPQTLKHILAQRKAFESKFSSVPELLISYNVDSVVSLSNTSDAHITLDPAPFFYDRSDIDRIISPLDSESSKEHLERIFEFAKTRHAHSIPLYESGSFHDPLLYINTLGTGFCDDAASLVASLASAAGFKARTLWLSGHVVAEVFFEDKWRVFDADALGLLHENGEFASHDYIVGLAKSNKLSQYNAEFASTEDNEARDDFVRYDKFSRSPRLKFFPMETRYFLDRAFVLTTNGRKLAERFQSKSDFQNNFQAIGNLVREIPLDPLRLSTSEDSLLVQDYFPFVAVFLRVPGQKHSFAAGDLPLAEVESESLDPGVWLPARAIDIASAKDTILDLSLALKNLENDPSFSIRIKNLAKLARVAREARLLVVQIYSRRNMKLRPAPQISNSSITVSYGSQQIS